MEGHPGTWDGGSHPSNPIPSPWLAGWLAGRPETDPPGEGEGPSSPDTHGSTGFDSIDRSGGTDGMEEETQGRWEGERERTPSFGGGLHTNPTDGHRRTQRSNESVQDASVEGELEEVKALHVEGEAKAASPTFMERSASRVRLLGAALREGARKRLAAFRRKGPAEISLLPLVALIFFEVSGGPFGTEDAVSAGGGPLLALLGFAILPLVWSVPEALVTAELSTAFPDNAGYAGWVRRAFGDFWGFQEGWWSWISGVVDNAVYPVLFFSYCQSVFPWLHAPAWRLPILFGSTIVMTYLNWRGLKIVGKAVVALAAASLLPFLIFTCIALTKANPSNWTYVDKSRVNVGVLLNTLFWNLNYWDSISTLAGEVEKPEHTLPKALRYGVLLVVASYFLPMLAGTGIGDPSDTHKWKEGYYSVLGDQVGGKWLGIMILLAAIASSIGLFLAEMSSDSFQLQGMASDGQLPAIFARRSRHGTPTLAILLSASGIVTLVTFSFIEVVELLNFMYCLAELLEFGAFLTLRVKNPDAPRPFKVPLNTWGAALMLLPASLLLAFLMLQATMKTVLVCSVAVAVGFLLYPFLQYSKSHGWCRFLDPEESVIAHMERPLDSEPPLEDLEEVDPEVTREVQEESTLLLPPENRSSSPS